MALDLAWMARMQNGVVTLDQALASGLTPSAVRWRVDHGQWQRLHRGVYVAHSGPVDDKARARAVLLRAGKRAALSHESALWVWGLGSVPKRWTVQVPNSIRRTVDGVEVIRTRRTTPRSAGGGFIATSVQRAIVDVADRPGADVDRVIGLVATACQRRLTTAERIRKELDLRRAHRLRRPLQLVVGDVAEGIESLAEHRFVHRVLRQHGLPPFSMQVLTQRGRVDFRNAAHALSVEVDGLQFHSGRNFRGDRKRDRKAGAEGDLTVRATWWDVEDEPCDLAMDLASVLLHRGWTGQATGCSPTCPVGRLEAS